MHEQGDYEAAPPTPAEATEYVNGAAAFIAEIERVLTGDETAKANSFSRVPLRGFEPRFPD